MAKTYIELGPSPTCENCAQVGTDGYWERAKKELTAYENQLTRMFPKAVLSNLSFNQKWFNHEFGAYGEVCVYWDVSDLEAEELAYSIEWNLPEFWDEEAKKELGIKNGNG